MFNICLFDLDDTLVYTSDLQWIREEWGETSGTELVGLLNSGLAVGERLIYSFALLQQIRAEFPDIRLGVFTRSRRSYAVAVLSWAYPQFSWDILVAYEDVHRTKPFGEGIERVMQRFDSDRLDRVILVGDSDMDIKASYHCGCLVALCRAAWPAFKKKSMHWRAVGLVADVVLQSPEALLEVLRQPDSHLPELERQLAGAEALHCARFDEINHFLPKMVGGDSTVYPIHVAGRSFSNYESLQDRRRWHLLTKSIERNKDVDVFPDEWVSVIRCFIENHYTRTNEVSCVIVSVVPHRPARRARLESLLEQFSQSVAEQPIEGFDICCQSKLLQYKRGVKSQHNDYLGRDERFMNVRDYLFVAQPEQIVADAFYLIVDDVTTTGASLIYAKKYLMEAGARNVTCFSMAKNIGNIV
ncbi:HAD hydrolase-like protein [Alcaligenes aquatilis]